MRRLVLAVLFSVPLALAVLVLYAQGRSLLAAEESRLAQGALASQRATLEGIRHDLAVALSDLVEREGARPYDDYQHLHVPADAVAREVALVKTSLAGEPREALVDLYFEWRDGALASPAIAPPSLGEGETAYARHVAERLADLRRIEPSLRARIAAPEKAPAVEEAVDRLIFESNTNVDRTMCNLKDAKGDELQHAWTEYQSRSGKVVGRPAPPERVIVRVYPMSYLREPPDETGWPRTLLAVRRVEVAGHAWPQGFAVKPLAMRERLEALIARAGPATAPEMRGSVPARSEPVVAVERHGAGLPLLPPLDGLALVHRGDPGRPRAALERSRTLLDGALALLVLVGTAGGAILGVAARSERRLARQRADFLAALTHELKAPLTGIRALTEVLGEGLVTEPTKQKEYYRSMLVECERLSRLVHNVLAASRLERGALPLAPESLDVAPLLHEAARTFAPRLETGGFAFELDLPESLPRVRVDREALVQVVTNLLDNAAKYGTGEERRVRLAASSEARSVTISVSDRGPGIPAWERERIFERFYRSPSAPREVGGAGLGLAIARVHARAHGGELTAGEGEGGGACFRLVLPREGP
ncbi:HAMP domain-containing histidine kinase [bacterium]|nr:HAMP domain-containing histidine kinase [bacterium]